MAEVVSSLQCTETTAQGTVPGSDRLRCVRQRGHDGEHMGPDYIGSRVTWADDEAGFLPIVLDEQTETIDTPTELEPVATTPWGEYGGAILFTLLILLWILTPAVIVGAYRLGF
jgi:hypothetical protein